MPAIDGGSYQLRDTFRKNSAPAFTAINGQPSSLSSHTLTEPYCLKAQKYIPRESSSRLVSHPIELECLHGPNECDGNANNKTKACDERPVGKRRQIFNRTTTGCGTCRRRKKKCDEAKPKCNNCLRGNFECAGYAKDIPRSNKNAAKVAPRLQSRERTSTATVTAHFVVCSVCNIVHIPPCGPSQKSYGEPRASSEIGTSRDRPLRTDKQGHKPLTRTWAEPQQHTSEHRRLPPIRPYSPLVNHLTPQSMALTVLNPSTAGTQLTRFVQPPPRVPVDEASFDDGSNASRFLPPIAPMLAAPPASPLSYYTHPNLHPSSEKDKMLSGKPFLPNTAQLVDERELALGALFHFNSAVVQIDPGGREWHFKRIVAAERAYPCVGERRVTGHLGSDINVSAPFYCDYGYNLSIGDNAVIGSGCQLLDSGRIAIGRNTKIGARVTISTLAEPTGARPLEGSKRTETAREVYIGEDVYIGDGCIIKGGVRIGDNAIVRAGSVVVQDVSTNCVVFGNPAKARQVDWED